MTKEKGQPQAYGDESYWDNRYSQDVGSFDWYQRYGGLAPLINMYMPKTNNLLMVGCGNAVISEDMVNDGYQTIMNIDISQVVIDAMIEKYKDMPQLQYQRMDVRSLGFKDGEFDSILDKGMFDSLMCGSSAPTSAASMIKEVRRVLKPGGVYMLITYGDPRVRIPHLKSEEAPWEIKLHVLPRPGSKRAHEGTSRPITEPVSLGEDLTLGPTFKLEDPDLHYVYVCIKRGGNAVKRPSGDAKVDIKLCAKSQLISNYEV
ncbi:uncharacterized protein [Physcomitrium patens]|uniref:Methyltransferase type 11 domain-containing protein n=3 Tax=Physcomitrium patens TaxID=3218 RepID=A0A2K1IY55_PHYPA|nr:EEF1A lysine methyltransferase 4-like isoform X2 [Physcomitrium patens]PNR34212.1 hypothetical protein PHYPA_024029 [Physcomitrium patens]|eukprot:XP_024403390.1 EEF1A lysine methyltransferase 4-like isoform X2 [Physcomitrella patens]